MRYLNQFIILTFLMLLLVAGVNYFIDPYQIYYSDTLHGTHLEKPAVYGTLRLHKAYAINQHAPKSVIIGSSKVQQGYDPDSKYLPYRQNYNLGLVRATAKETYSYLRHSAATGQLKSVVLAVDLFSYNAYMPNRNDFDEERLNYSKQQLGEKQWFSPSVKYFDIVPTIFSISALKASLDTWLNATIGTRPLIFSNGRENPKTLQNELDHLGGNFAASLIMERQFANSFMTPAPYYNFDFVDKVNSIDTLKTFSDILRFSHAHDLDLKVVINPFHAVHYVMYQEMDRWDFFEQWKRQLVEINDQVANELGEAAFPLWDFTAINSVTTEPIPEADSGAKDMMYFWETVHFKSNVGDYILAKIYDQLSIESIKQWPKDFGVTLNKNNIEQQLTLFLRDLSQYRDSHAQQLSPFINEYREAKESLMHSAARRQHKKKPY